MEKLTKGFNRGQAISKIDPVSRAQVVHRNLSGDNLSRVVRFWAKGVGTDVFPHFPNARLVGGALRMLLWGAVRGSALPDVVGMYKSISGKRGNLRAS